ncbi:hypothetical protein FQN54_007791 [Arachnomyces sp. PD_36]|nr:hypothetical protein FQN54_007791 [Arachnomyces sp. PD_36]
MPPLSEIPVNQLHQGRQQGAWNRQDENVKLNAPREERHPRQVDSFVDDIASQPQRNRRRRPPGYRPPPQMSPSLRIDSANRRHDQPGSRDRVRRPGAYGPLYGARTASTPQPVFPRPRSDRNQALYSTIGHTTPNASVLRDYGHYTAQEVDFNRKAYPREIHVSPAKPTFGGEKGVATVQDPDDGESHAQPLSGCFPTTRSVVSSGGDTTSSQTPVTFPTTLPATFPGIPPLVSDSDTLRLSSPVPQSSSPKPAMKATVFYYDYSEPFHEVPTTVGSKTTEITTAGQSGSRESHLNTDFGATIDNRALNVEDPPSIDLVSETSTSNSDDGESTKSAEAEAEDKLLAPVCHDSCSDPVPASGCSPPAILHKAPPRELPQISHRYLEKGTQTDTDIGTRCIASAEVSKDQHKIPIAGEGILEAKSRLPPLSEAGQEELLWLKASNSLRHTRDLSSHLSPVTENIEGSQDINISMIAQGLDSSSGHNLDQQLQPIPTKPPGQNMEMIQEPVPSFQRAIPDNTQPNHYTSEITGLGENPQRTSSDQAQKQCAEFGLSRRPSTMRSGGVLDRVRSIGGIPVSYTRCTLTRCRSLFSPFEIPPRDGNPGRTYPNELIDEAKGHNPGFHGTEPHGNDIAVLSPIRDSEEIIDFRSHFSDDSSCLPRRSFMKRLSGLKTRISSTRRPSILGGTTQDAASNPQNSSELNPARETIARRVSIANPARVSEREPMRRKSISKTRDVWRRYSLYEKRRSLVQ